MNVAGFSEFFKGLGGALGNGRENRDHDVKQVKRGLGRLGYWDEPEHGLNGILDRELDTGIKEFQADHDRHPLERLGGKLRQRLWCRGRACLPREAVAKPLSLRTFEGVP
jgi:hypothetical protein